ncbi:MAG TPA: nucleoside monophosphate kinase [Methylomirabilota bacterium]|nr:nucleoside monophosphate kinase [Methylomirabilota bacterium]
MKLQNVILLMGPPGSGKGTQSKLLVDKLGFAYFSMGDTLREFAKMDTDLGREIKNTIDQGIIVPDSITKDIIREKFSNFLDKPGVVFDGFPRTVGQDQDLREILEKYEVPHFQVFFLEVDKEKLLKRLTTRKTCPNCQAIYLPDSPEYKTEICKICGSKISIRKDDQDQASIEKRFDEYILKTKPVKEYYESQGLLTTIAGDQADNAEQSIKMVHQEILNKLGIK